MNLPETLAAAALVVLVLFAVGLFAWTVAGKETRS